MEYPILVFGAKGDSVDRLIALLEAAGFPPIRTVGGPLDVPVIEAVERAQQELGIVEPNYPDIPINGKVITKLTTDGLLAAAAARTGLLLPTAAADAEAKALIESSREPAAARPAAAAPASSTSSPAAAAAPEPPATGAAAAAQAAQASDAIAAQWRGQAPGTEAP